MCFRFSPCFKTLEVNEFVPETSPLFQLLVSLMIICLLCTINNARAERVHIPSKSCTFGSVLPAVVKHNFYFDRECSSFSILHWVIWACTEVRAFGAKYWATIVCAEGVSVQHSQFATWWQQATSNSHSPDGGDMHIFSLATRGCLEVANQSLTN